MLGMGHGKQDKVTVLEESLVWWVGQTQKQTKFSERWFPDKARIGQPSTQQAPGRDGTCGEQ